MSSVAWYLAQDTDNNSHTNSILHITDGVTARELLEIMFSEALAQLDDKGATPRRITIALNRDWLKENGYG